MGDVAGHGMAAAVVVGSIRSALRAYILLDLPPEEALRRVDIKVCHFEIEALATVACAVATLRLEPGPMASSSGVASRSVSGSSAFAGRQPRGRPILSRGKLNIRGRRTSRPTVRLREISANGQPRVSDSKSVPAGTFYPRLPCICVGAIDHS